MPATKTRTKTRTKTSTKTSTKKKANRSGKSMTIAQIRNKAKAHGIHQGTMNKAELIRTIQMAEGYTPCFGTSNGHCVHTECCFIKDCLKTKR